MLINEIMWHNFKKYVSIILRGIFVLAIGSFNTYGAALNTLYSNNAKVTVSSAMVSGSSTINDFVLLLDIDGNSELQTVGNGGNIESADGYDIVFAPQQTSDETEVFKHYLESYNASTGELIIWVQVDLNALSDTEFYMFYGRSGMTDPTDASLWSDASYIGVWQLSETPGAGTVVDATSNSANGSAFGNVAVDASSVVGQGYAFDGAGDYVSIPDNTSIEPSGDFTISCWFKSNGGQNDYAKMFAKGRLAAPYASYTLEMRSDGVNYDNEVGFQTGRTDGTHVLVETNGNGVDDIEDGEWYYFVGVVDVETGSVTQSAYLNGQLIDSDNSNSNGIDYYTSTTYDLIIGGLYDGGINNEFSGTIDELRIADVVRSEDYIMTERNNVSCGSAFITIDNVGLNCNAASVLPIKLKNFTAEWIGDNVQLNWTTYSETNNDYFTIERSNDGQNFEQVGKANGAGNSETLQSYSAIDNDPYPAVSYYRLKQTDFDGKYSYSKLIALPAKDISETFVKLFPNPNNGEVNLKAYNIAGKDVEIRITDMSGKVLSTYQVTNEADVFNENFDLNYLTPGNYIFSINSRNTIIRKKLVIE